MVSHTANSYDIPTVCEKLTNQKIRTKSLCCSWEGRGGGGGGVEEGHHGDEVAEQEMDKLQFLVVDTCDLFTTLNCCSNFWGYGD